jgi:hypothetical protein
VTSQIVSATEAGIKTVTITGYLTNLAQFVNRTLNLRNVNLLDNDKRDQDKVVSQLPKRKPQGKNFYENDPRIDKI